VSKGRAEMWSACACACVCVCSPVRTYVDAMRCAGCSCVNDAIDGRIAGRSTPKRKASYSSHTSSYFSYRFHISSHVVTPGKVQFSLGVRVILLSCANQCIPSGTDGQQQGTKPVSCCCLRTRCMQRREYTLVACTTILILSTFHSIQC